MKHQIIKVIAAALLAAAGGSCTVTPARQRTAPPPPIPVVATSLDAPAIDVAARWFPLQVEPGVPQLMQPARVRLVGQFTFEDPARILGIASVVLDHVVTPDGVDLMASRPPAAVPDFFWPVPSDQQTGKAPVAVQIVLPTPAPLPDVFQRISGRAYVLWADDYRTFDLPIGKPTAYPGEPAKPGKWQKLAEDFHIRLVQSEVGPRSVEVQTEYRARDPGQVRFQGWTEGLRTPFIARATLVGTSSPDYTLSPLGGSARTEPWSNLVHGTAGKYAGFAVPVDYSALRLFVARAVSIREIRFDLADVQAIAAGPATVPAPQTDGSVSPNGPPGSGSPD